jgi:hypothetical protein
VPQGDSRPTDLAEGRGVLIRRDVREPREIEVVGEFAEIAFLIHHRGVKEVVDGGALEESGFLQELADCGQVFASASAGWFE